jgi:sugar (glycoside-pentoside-hexuronide) transporter
MMQSNKLPVTTKIAYGVAAFSEGMVGLGLAFALLRFYTNVVGIDPKYAGLALLLPRIWDAISDPIMGYISDNTRSRLGRRRPYLLYGAIPLGLSFLMLWIPSGNWPMWMKIAHLAFASFIWNSMHTIVIMPYAALGAELSNDYHERTSVAVYRQFFAFLGALPGAFVYSFVASFSSEATGFAAAGLVGGVALATSFLITFLFCKETFELKPQERMPILPSIIATFKNRSFNLILVPMLVIVWAFAYGGGFWPYIIFDVVKKDANWMSLCLVIMNLSSVAILPAYMALSRRFGKKNAFTINMLVFCVVHGTSFLFLNEQYPFLSALYASMCGLALGGWAAIGAAIVADIVDEDELVTGKRREGAFFGLHNVLIKTANAVATLVVGLTLSWSGYNIAQGAIQTTDTIFKLKLIYALVPALIFVVTATFFHFTFPLTPKRAAEVRAELNRRDSVSRSKK